MKRKEGLNRSLDPELEVLWRKGLDESQYEKVLEKLVPELEPELPQGLRADLLGIPSRMNHRATKHRYPFSIPHIPALAATAVLLLIVSAALILEHRDNQQISLKTDSFLKGIIDYNMPNDIFDTDVQLLELL